MSLWTVGINRSVLNNQGTPREGIQIYGRDHGLWIKPTYLDIDYPYGEANEIGSGCVGGWYRQCGANTDTINTGVTDTDISLPRRWLLPIHTYHFLWAL